MQKRHLLLLALIIAIGFLFWYSLSLQDAFYQGVEKLRPFIEKNNDLGLVLFTLLAALSAMLSPFSSIPLVPVFISFWGKFLTGMLLLLGWLLGGIFTYGIGAGAGRPIFEKLTSTKKIEHYKNLIEPHLSFGMVLLFRLSMPAEIPGYVLGIVRFHFWKYVLATFIAELPFAFITVYASDALIEKKTSLYITASLVAIAAISLFFILFQKKLH